MKVYEALAEAFVKEGVTTIFGLMGNGNMYWWHTLDQRPDVTVYETRHEGTALTMAEGWARASGQPGVCTVTQGPGLTQLGTALTVATRAKVPMVVFAGDTALGDHDSVQQLDQAKFVDATEAGFVPTSTSTSRRPRCCRAGSGSSRTRTGCSRRPGSSPRVASR